MERSSIQLSTIHAAETCKTASSHYYIIWAYYTIYYIILHYLSSRYLAINPSFVNPSAESYQHRTTYVNGATRAST